MKYENYTVFDFVKNEDFQRWVKNSDEKSDFFWKSWMQNHSDKKHLVIEAKEILTSINFPGQKASKDEIEGILEKILKNDRPVSLRTIESNPVRKSYKLKNVFSIAAAVVILAIFGFLFYNLYSDPNEPRAEVKSIEHIKKNPLGRKSTFHLTDGSIVKLNAASELRIANDFGIKNREVFLEGEAYFEVAKNTQKPFIVHTGNLSTLVTGTAFNVNAYQESKDIKVAVVEGSVKTMLYHENGVETLSLEKSDMVVYNKPSSSLAKTYFNYIEVLGWKDGIIYFKDASSEEIFNYLEMWYGVEIQIKNQGEIPESFYGEFTNETLENVLIQISHALQFEYFFKDNEVFVEPKRK